MGFIGTPYHVSHTNACDHAPSRYTSSSENITQVPLDTLRVACHGVINLAFSKYTNNSRACWAAAFVWLAVMFNELTMYVNKLILKQQRKKRDDWPLA